MSEIQFLLLIFIMPEDDNIRLMCFREAADVPGRFIEEVPDEMYIYFFLFLFSKLRRVTARQQQCIAYADALTSKKGHIPFNFRPAMLIIIRKFIKKSGI